MCLSESHVITNIFFTPPEFFTLFTRQQFERYEKYIVARYSAYNVMWNICGEYTEQSIPSEYAYHGNVVYNHDSYKHPISIHPSGNQTSSTHFANDKWHTYIMQQIGSQTSNVYMPIINDRIYNKPVVNGEAAYLGYNITIDNWRKQNWMINIAGGFMTTGYNNVFWTEYGFDLNDSDNLIGMSQMKNLYNFFNTIEFWKMNPDNSIINNGYALTNSINDYVIYLPNGGPTTVNLSSSPGSLNVEWYNPRTGVYQGQTSVQGGASRTFTSPDSNDWVLHIKADTGTKGFFMNLWKTFLQQIFPKYEIGG